MMVLFPSHSHSISLSLSFSFPSSLHSVTSSSFPVRFTHASLVLPSNPECNQNERL